MTTRSGRRSRTRRRNRSRERWRWGSKESDFTEMQERLSRLRKHTVTFRCVVVSQRTKRSKEEEKKRATETK